MVRCPIRTGISVLAGIADGTLEGSGLDAGKFPESERRSEGDHHQWLRKAEVDE
jgi:hypothetical protein